MKKLIFKNLFKNRFFYARLCLIFYEKLTKNPITMVVNSMENQKIIISHTFNRNFLIKADLDMFAVKMLDGKIFVIF